MTVHLQTLRQDHSVPHTHLLNVANMDQQNVADRKPSRSRTAFGRAILSRKATKKATEPPADPPHPGKPPSFRSVNGKGKERERENEWQDSQEDSMRPPLAYRTADVIPDPLGELPSWFQKDIETATPNVQFRSRYPLHNPVGPRWYKNHHLLPPPREKRPPTFFSPSFPPMSSVDQETPSSPGPSRSPSGSPLPTPSSSQIRIQDPNGKVRVRKISQTAHDNVDMMDVTDPWGTNWHHQSPYDVGLTHDRNAATSEPIESQTSSKSRRMSFTTSGSRHKTTTPSPLSQSTSAVHLQASDTDHISPPRRLSKRRKPFNNLFTEPDPNNPPPKPASAPTTPVDAPPYHFLGTRKRSRRQSSVGPSVSSIPTSYIPPGEKKQRTGGILGRLAKRFSVLRKPDAGTLSFANGVQGGFTRAEVGTKSVHVQQPNQKEEASTNDNRISTSAKRVPPPTAVDEPTSNVIDDKQSKYDEGSLSSSSNPLPSIGKLTVANPDEPSSSPSLSELSLSIPSIPENIVPNTPASSMAPPVNETNTVLPPTPPPDSTPSPLQRAESPPSPPLPDLPLPTPYITNRENTLPPTPAGTRPSSPAKDIGTSVASSSPTITPHSVLPSAAPTSLLAAYATSWTSEEDPSLSRASILVNPPTPAPMTIVIPSGVPPLPTASPVMKHSSSRESSPTKGKEGSLRTKSTTPTRKTETFKLVRSPSGHMQTVGETIIAMGDHWEVVESPVDAPKKSKTKDTERQRSGEGDGGSSRRESRRQDSGEGGEPRRERERERDRDRDRERERERERDRERERERDRDRERERARDMDRENGQRRHGHRSSNGRASVEYIASSNNAASRLTRSSSLEPSRRSVAPERVPSSQKHRSNASRKRESETDFSRSTTTPIVHNGKSHHQSAPAGGIVRMDRHPSTSTRPSSEFQSAADLMALKATEAWEIERLWKGGSMAYGSDGVALSSARPAIGDDSRPSTFIGADLHRASTIPSVGTMSPVGHGSNHTYFMVQGPSQVQQPHHGSYPQAPVPPPPTIYAATSHPHYHGRGSSAPYDYSKSYSSFERIPFPTDSTNHIPFPHPSSNPLPEPPRLSSYEPSPLPPSIANARDRVPSANYEYWTNYAGIATSR